MKKLFLLFSLLLSFTIIRAQETPPTPGTNFKQINPAQFWYDFTNNKVWLYRGNSLWLEMARKADLPIITVSNGLTKTGNDIALGGDYGSNILIGGTNKGSLQLTAGAAFMEYNNGTNYYSQVSASSADVNFGLTSLGSMASININPDDGIKVTDEIKSKGMFYNFDYSSNWTNDALYDNYLTNKKYVDTKFSDIDLSNYVTKTGTETLTNKTLSAPDINNGNINNANIVNGSINNTPIGGGVPSTGLFTTLNATSSSTLAKLAGGNNFTGVQNINQSGATTSVNELLSLKSTGTGVQNSPALSFYGQAENGALRGTRQYSTFTQNGQAISAVNYFQSYNGVSWQNRTAMTDSGFAIYNNDNSGFAAYVNPTALTSNRSFDVPNENGTFALRSDFATNKTIGANTTGSATYWGGRTADFDTTTPNILRMVAIDNATGQAKQADKTIVNSYLGINDGSALNNVASNSTLWNGLSYGGSDNLVDNYIMTYKGGGTYGPTTKEATKTFLATSLQDVAVIGNRATTSIGVTGGSGVENVLSFGTDVGIMGTVSNHDLAFYVNSTEKARILANGNVGIGTTSPRQKLDVNGNVFIGEVLPLMLSHDASQNSQLSGVYFTTDNTGYSFGIGKRLASNGVKTNIMTFLDNGDVGIGTGSPTAKLDVNGDIKANNLSSGTYTPTAEGLNNNTSPSITGFKYSRVGNIVTFSGRLTTYITTASVGTQIAFTIPIASTFDTLTDVTGTVTVYNPVNQWPRMQSNGSRVEIQFVAGAVVGAHELDFSGQYEIK